MLSAQADELRELALWLDDEFYDEYATRARDAADTILSLRDKAQELQAENANLREENRIIGQVAYELGRNSMADENAKLRELVRAAWKCIHSGLSCSDCRLIACGCTLQSAMRELGIEVGA
jgi:hypothetical protein